MFLDSDRGHDDSIRDGKADEAIAAEIQRIHALHHGRRPATARTIWRENVLVCVLEGVFTAEDAKRAANGDFERVRRERLARREAIEPPSRALVETVTGHPVRAYMAELSPEDVAVEAFILGDPGPPGR